MTSRKHESEAIRLLHYILRYRSLDWLAWGTKRRTAEAFRWFAREEKLRTAARRRAKR